MRLPAGTETIYKWGETLSQREWFTWPTEVDVCRGQLAGDDLEWTIFTGDGYPKITNANLHGYGEPPETAPEEPPEEPVGGSATINEIYRSYIRQFDSIHAGASTIDLVIAPLEDAFVLASGAVTISGGGLASNMTDLSALNSAITGSHSSLAAFESTVKNAAPAGFNLWFAPSYRGRLLKMNHGAHGPVGEELTLASPFEATW